MIIGRFSTVTPISLFRIQAGVKVRLRSEALARAAGRKSFDIAEREGGVVVPVDPAVPEFLGPNGMSMRPAGRMLAVIVGTFRSSKALLYEVPAGTRIPTSLVLLHEHSDHYSMQPAERMPLARLNAALTTFLSQEEVIRHASIDAFYEKHPDHHPTKVGFSENA